MSARILHFGSIVLIFVGVVLLGVGLFPRSFFGNAFANIRNHFKDNESFSLAQRVVASLKIYNLPRLSSDSDGKVFNINDLNPPMLKLTANGEKTLRGKSLTVRIFRRHSVSAGPQLLKIDADGCEIYYSVPIPEPIVSNDLQLKISLNEYWLGRDDRGNLVDGAYTVVLEEGLHTEPFVKILPGKRNAYFASGFKIVVRAGSKLSPDKIRQVLEEWNRFGGMPAPATALCTDIAVSGAYANLGDDLVGLRVACASSTGDSNLQYGATYEAKG